MRIFKAFVYDVSRSVVSFIIPVIVWNFVFPFMFWEGFTSGAIEYLDNSEIFMIGISPFLGFLFLHFRKRNYFAKTKKFAYLIFLVLSLIGSVATMLGYQVLASNLDGLVFNNIIPSNINFGFGFILWIALICQGSFTPSETFEEKNSASEEKVENNTPQPPQAQPETASAAKTIALPNLPIQASQKAEPKAEPKIQVAPEPKVEAKPESTPESKAEVVIVSKPTPTPEPKIEVLEAIKVGTIIENVEFEANTGENRTGLKAVNRIGGKVAFPDRRGEQPEAGDIWTVEITGTNPKGTVYFVKCLKRESTLEQRQAIENSTQNSTAQDPSQGIQL
ncbi:hypothetical protein EBU94_06155 [bacterium]|nr:hypothetical protein [bacterium]NBO35997.1 hypothetical protein [bacterium]